MNQVFENIIGKKILLIEEDDFLSDIVIRKFSSINCTILKEKNGTNAIDVIKKEKPDMVLLDILLPGRGGLEILEEMKNDSNLQNIPVVILSNMEEEEGIQRSKKLGARFFLLKAKATLDDILGIVNQELGEIKK